MDLSITLDENAKDVLVTLVQTGGAFAVGVVVAMLGFRHARGLEKDRWGREDARRAEDQARDDARLWAAEKRHLFARLAQHADGMREVARRAYRGWQVPQELMRSNDELWRTLSEVTMIAPAVEPAGTKLYRAVGDLWEGGFGYLALPEGERPQPPPDDEREAAFEKALDEFYRSARLELGIEPRA